LYAMSAGDVTVALDYLQQAVSLDRDAKNMVNLSISLQNLADCLSYLGRIGPARETIAEALTYAQASGEQTRIRNEHAYSGWLASLTNDSEQAEQHFTAADQIEY